MREVEKNLTQNWVLGNKGEVCDDTCKQYGSQCDSTKQSELTTKQKVKNAMNEAGVSCNSLAGPRASFGFSGLAGTPFYNDGTCVYLRAGAQSVCDQNKHPNHQPLCYCKGK